MPSGGVHPITVGRNLCWTCVAEGSCKVAQHIALFARFAGNDRIADLIPMLPKTIAD
jgi:hypothetical protein